MNFLKTPQQMLMEDAGMAPASPGMLHTPKQMLLNETGIVPKMAEGGQPQQQMSPEDMMALMLAYGQTPQKLAGGGKPEAMSPEFAALLDRLYSQQIYSGELPPEPTFQAQPKTAASATRDMAAKLLGETPADRLFGTGSEGQKTEYLPLQFLNPFAQGAAMIDAVPETARQVREGDYGQAGLTAGLTTLGTLPFVAPAKKMVKSISKKIKK
jgi:hypothetical protein